MQALMSIFQVVQILAAIGMIGLILVQHGKGADAGAAFGSGAGSASLFGATGGANFLSRSTAVLAAVFLIMTLALAYMGGHRTVAPTSGSVLEGAAAPAAADAAPAAADAVPATQEKPVGAGQIPGQ